MNKDTIDAASEYVIRHQFTEGGIKEIVANKIARESFIAGALWAFENAAKICDDEASAASYVTRHYSESCAKLIRAQMEER